MTRLRDTFPLASFDAVIDKAGMDAVLADGGDVWDPPSHLLSAARACTHGVARVLRDRGTFLSLSFAQPHFRRAYLAPDVDGEGWGSRSAGAQADADGDGSYPCNGSSEARRFLTLSAQHRVNVGLGYHLYCLHLDGGACPLARV